MEQALDALFSDGIHNEKIIIFYAFIGYYFNNTFLHYEQHMKVVNKYIEFKLVPLINDYNKWIDIFYVCFK